MSRKKSSSNAGRNVSGALAAVPPPLPKLEVVLKCDSMGAMEAVREAIDALAVPGVRISVIQAGVGSISKKDVLMAQTGSRLIVGFNVDTVPRLDMDLSSLCVEVRLYRVIYRLTEDLKDIARHLAPREARETILGRGRVIAVFPARRKGMILGCEVLDGAFVAGKQFRLISPMGPVFTGTIGSLQIEKTPVKRAPAGRQAGILMAGGKKAAIGDQVECFDPVRTTDDAPWHPTCGIFSRE